jgi:hypothetical protein
VALSYEAVGRPRTMLATGSGYATDGVGVPYGITASLYFPALTREAVKGRCVSACCLVSACSLYQQPQAGEPASARCLRCLLNFCVGYSVRLRMLLRLSLRLLLAWVRVG